MPHLVDVGVMDFKFKVCVVMSDLKSSLWLTSGLTLGVCVFYGCLRSRGGRRQGGRFPCSPLQDGGDQRDPGQDEVVFNLSFLQAATLLPLLRLWQLCRGVLTHTLTIYTEYSCTQSLIRKVPLKYFPTEPCTVSQKKTYIQDFYMQNKSDTWDSSALRVCILKHNFLKLFPVERSDSLSSSREWTKYWT